MLFTPEEGEVVTYLGNVVLTPYDGTSPTLGVGQGQGNGDIGWFQTDLTVQSSLFGSATAISPDNPNIPSWLLSSDPIEVWISQDGTKEGADSGCTLGESYVYFIRQAP